MIRRLILFEPITEAEAKAATLMAGKMLAGQGHTVEYRVSPRSARVLMFETNLSRRRSGERVASVRLLDDPAAQSMAVANAAFILNAPVFNVYTAHPTNPTWAYSGTDAVFSVGLPEGNAVAWCSRVPSGIAPGIVARCLAPVHANRSSPVFLAREQWLSLREAARPLFFKNKPVGWQRGEALVLKYARSLLAEFSAGSAGPKASSRP